ncbi:hypothetical protein CPB86DRAFT_58133 [Serendipita vermifera]|nr:hypothetical protein CPB86DRAFT_58133 [Serendipita vermifera]
METSTDDSYDLPFPHPRYHPARDEVLSSRKRIKNLDHDIAKLQNEINIPLYQLQFLQRGRRNHASYISPLRCLPADIIREIFSICLDVKVKLATLMQICGTFRDIVTGMSTIWRRIHLARKGRYKYTISDRLSLVLGRAGSVPLDLCIELPAEQDRMDLISSYQCLVRSLTISHDGDDIEELPFHVENINMHLLKRVSFKGGTSNLWKRLMDLALRSIQREITVEIRSGEPVTDALLSHKVFLRVNKLCISAGLLELTGPINIPYLRCLEFTGYTGPIQLLRLCDLQALPLYNNAALDGLAVAPISMLLTELTLNGGVFPPEDLEGRRPCSLIHLTTLVLYDIHLEAPLQSFLTFPSLKNLNISALSFNVSHLSYEGVSEHEFANLVSERCPVQGFPHLETLSLAIRSVNESLLVQLESCPRLQSLTLACNLTRNFVLNFAKYIGEKESLPALRIFDLACPWLDDFGISHEEFLEVCAVKRPSLHIYSKVWLEETMWDVEHLLAPDYNPSYDSEL